MSRQCEQLLVDTYRPAGKVDSVDCQPEGFALTQSCAGGEHDQGLVALRSFSQQGADRCGTERLAARGTTRGSTMRLQGENGISRSSTADLKIAQHHRKRETLA